MWGIVGKRLFDKKKRLVPLDELKKMSEFVNMQTNPKFYLCLPMYKDEEVKEEIFRYKHILI